MNIEELKKEKRERHNRISAATREKRGDELKKKFAKFLPKTRKRRGGLQKRYESVRARIIENMKIEPKSKCWIAQFSTTLDGYPQMSSPYGEYRIIFSGKRKGRKVAKMVRVNRVSFQEFNGPIPEDKIVGHKCNNPLCTNPDHLILQTLRENSQYMADLNRSPNLDGSSRGSRGMKKYRKGDDTFFFLKDTQPKGWELVNKRTQ